MDWANERYVRLYTRDTGDWALWPWQTRSLFCLILRKVDRAGIISCGKGKLRALSKVVDMPEAEIVIAIEPLIEDGCIQFNEAGDLIVANFIEAQEVLSTPAARQRDSRERRRDMISRGLRPEQRACAIYFIQPENGGSVKIGRAEDVAKRLVQMQTSRPDKLVVVAAAPGTYEDERRLHDAFADSRDRGEWFTPDDGLTALICHVNETGHIPSDLSRFVTSHSDPIRSVPSLAKPSCAGPDAAASEELPEAPRISERRLKSVPPPPLPPVSDPDERDAVVNALRAQPKLADLDVGDLASFAVTRMVAKGTRLAWVLQAIEEAAEKSQRGEQSHVRHARVIGFIKHAKGPPSEGGRSETTPAHRDFAYAPGELEHNRTKRMGPRDLPPAMAALVNFGRGPRTEPSTEAQLRDKAQADQRRLAEMTAEQERKAGGT